MTQWVRSREKEQIYTIMTSYNKIENGVIIVSFHEKQISIHHSKIIKIPPFLMSIYDFRGISLHISKKYHWEWVWVQIKWWRWAFYQTLSRLGIFWFHSFWKWWRNKVSSSILKKFYLTTLSISRIRQCNDPVHDKFWRLIRTGTGINHVAFQFLIASSSRFIHSSPFSEP